MPYPRKCTDRSKHQPVVANTRTDHHFLPLESCSTQGEDNLRAHRSIIFMYGMAQVKTQIYVAQLLTVCYLVVVASFPGLLQRLAHLSMQHPGAVTIIDEKSLKKLKKAYGTQAVTSDYYLNHSFQHIQADQWNVQKLFNAAKTSQLGTCLQGMRLQSGEEGKVNYRD
jgi:hypothetical protein